MPEVQDVPVSGGEITLAVKALNAIRKKLGKPEHLTVLEARLSRRSELRDKLRWPDSGVPEVIVVRLSKMNKYPDTDSLFFGLFPNSPWNKFEVKKAGDRDLEVFLRIESVYFTGRRKRKARRAPLNGSPPPGGAQTYKVWVVGRIPYEKIKYFDWSADPAYSLPRIYVDYGLRGAFREIAIYEESGMGGRDSTGPHLYEIHDAEYQGEVGNPWRWSRSTASRLRFALEQRREEKRFERETRR